MLAAADRGPATLPPRGRRPLLPWGVPAARRRPADRVLWFTAHRLRKSRAAPAVAVAYAYDAPDWLRR